MLYLLTKFHSVWSRGMCVGNTRLAALLAAPHALLSRRPSVKPFPPLTKPAVTHFTCESLISLVVHVAACKRLVLIQIAFFFFPLLLLIQLI